jgi:hypothetical protein
MPTRRVDSNGPQHDLEAALPNKSMVTSGVEVKIVFAMVANELRIQTQITDFDLSFVAIRRKPPVSEACKKEFCTSARLDNPPRFFVPSKLISEHAADLSRDQDILSSSVLITKKVVAEWRWFSRHVASAIKRISAAPTTATNRPICTATIAKPLSSIDQRTRCIPLCRQARESSRAIVESGCRH